MELVTGRHVVTLELLEALGLKDRHCFSLNLDFGAGSLATVTAGMYLDEKGAKALIKEMKKYNLVPIAKTENTTLLGQDIETFAFKEDLSGEYALDGPDDEKVSYTEHLRTEKIQSTNWGQLR